MRHRCKVHHLARPQDQRKALLRTLATSLFEHGQIKTTLHRAKALREYADHIITLAKQAYRADEKQYRVHKIRRIAALVYNQPLLGEVNASNQATGESKGPIGDTVVRRICYKIAPQMVERKGGYTAVIPMAPRRGDAAPMACVQLVGVDLEALV